jgi:hypothetical protein
MLGGACEIFFIFLAILALIPKLWLHVRTITRFYRFYIQKTVQN